MKYIELQKKSSQLENELISNIILNPQEALKKEIPFEDIQRLPIKKAIQVVIIATQEGKNIYAEFSSKGISVSEYMGNETMRTISSVIEDIKKISSTMRIYQSLEEALQTIDEENAIETISNLNKDFLNTVKTGEIENPQISSIIDEYKNKQSEYEERFKNDPDGIIGLSTGYSKLDSVIDGLRPEHLWIIGGYTNVGKSAAALNIISEQVRHDRKFVFYSLEMGSLDIVSRLVGIMTNQNGKAILKSQPHDSSKVNTAFDHLKNSKSSIYTLKYDLGEIIFSMRQEMIRNPVSVYVIDFIQNILVKDAKTEYETLTTAVIAFQKIAKELKVPVIVLSQVSNESANSGDRTVIGFKGSGAIAAAADIGIEITNGEESMQVLQDKMTKGLPVNMKWKIRKNRHGPTGFIDMVFNGKTGLSVQYAFDD